MAFPCQMFFFTSDHRHLQRLLNNTHTDLQVEVSQSDVYHTWMLNPLLVRAINRHPCLRSPDHVMDRSCQVVCKWHKRIAAAAPTQWKDKHHSTWMSFYNHLIQFMISNINRIYFVHLINVLVLNFAMAFIMHTHVLVPKQPKRSTASDSRPQNDS